MWGETKVTWEETEVCWEETKVCWEENEMTAAVSEKEEMAIRVNAEATV